MQIQLIVRPGRRRRTRQKGDEDEHGFCPFVAHRAVRGSDQRCWVSSCKIQFPSACVVNERWT